MSTTDKDMSTTHVNNRETHVNNRETHVNNREKHVNNKMAANKCFLHNAFLHTVQRATMFTKIGIQEKM